jgi:hypothetical protein
MVTFSKTGEKSVDLVRGTDGGGSGIGVEVHPVGSDVEGELGGAVDEDAGLAFYGPHGLDDAGGKKLELGQREIFFAELDGVDSAAGPFFGKGNEAVALCVLVSIEEAAIRDGVEEHLRNQDNQAACCVSVFTDSHGPSSLDCKMGSELCRVIARAGQFSQTWRNTICWSSVRALQDSGRRCPR